MPTSPGYLVALSGPSVFDIVEWGPGPWVWSVTQTRPLGHGIFHEQGSQAIWYDFQTDRQTDRQACPERGFKSTAVMIPEWVHETYPIYGYTFQNSGRDETLTRPTSSISLFPTILSVRLSLPVFLSLYLSPSLLHPLHCALSPSTSLLLSPRLSFSPFIPTSLHPSWFLSIASSHLVCLHCSLPLPFSAFAPKDI